MGAATGSPKGSTKGASQGAAKGQPAGVADLTRALNRAAGYFNHALARSMDTRITPRVTFVYDPTFDYAQHMENVLKPLREAGEMGRPEEAGGEAEAAPAAPPGRPSGAPDA